MDFNPNWTLEEARTAQAEALRAGLLVSDPTGPLYQWAACRRLEDEEGRYKSGDAMALMGAIRICANHDLPLPRWASSAYIAAYDRVLGCRAKSWDAVFGKPYQKGAHLSAFRKRREKKFAVWLAVNEILAKEPYAAVDESLFERAGKSLGLGKTLASEFYYAVKRQLEP